jgi:hypothetical protein
VRDLTRPSDELELIDDPAVDPDELCRALDDIELSNAWLGGAGASLGGLWDLVLRAARDGRRPVQLLEVGAGAAGTARRLCRRARAAGLELRVLACDLSPIAARHARARSRDEPWLQVVRADALRPPLGEGAVDLVHAALLLHHVPRPEQAPLLRGLAGLARVGLVVADLERRRWAHEGVRLFGWATRRGRLFRNDAPLSVARGFSLDEARALVREARVPGLRVRREPFARLVFTAGPAPLPLA